MIHQWYKLNIDLYHKELTIIKKQIKDYFIMGYEEGKDLSVLGRIDIDGIWEKILIIYSTIYPYKSPAVWLLEDKEGINIVDFSDHYHQNYNKSLCLFTSDWGEGSWHFTMDTSIVLDKLRESIRRARSQEHTDDHFSIINPVPGKMRSDLEIYIPIEIMNHILENIKKFNYLELIKFSRNDQGRILKYPQEKNVYEKLFRGKSWSKLNLSDKFKTGCYLKLPFKEKEFRKNIKDKTDLIQILKKFGLPDEFVKDLSFVFLIFSDTNLEDKDSKQVEHHFTSFYLLNKREISNIFRIPLAKVYPIDLPNDIFKRITPIFNNNLDSIQNKTVLILGLGTLGSFIALELVKTGIRNFLLYDFDILQPVNICRHIGDIKDIGRYKTDVVEEKLILKNPEINIKKRNRNPFEGEHLLAQFVEDIDNSDIIIDTTASYQANLQLNKIALEREKTVIYGWCGPNAEAGRIFRVIPNKTPCYYCVNLQLEKEPEKFLKIKKESNEYIRHQFVGYRQPGIPGISIDINFIGLFISRFCIQTLLIDDENYPDAVTHHYIWQNKSDEVDDNLEIGICPQGQFLKILRCPVCKSITKKMYNPRKKREIEEILKQTKSNLKRLERQ